MTPVIYFFLFMPPLDTYIFLMPPLDIFMPTNFDTLAIHNYNFYLYYNELNINWMNFEYY